MNVVITPSPSLTVRNASFEYGCCRTPPAVGDTITGTLFAHPATSDRSSVRVTAWSDRVHVRNPQRHPHVQSGPPARQAEADPPFLRDEYAWKFATHIVFATRRVVPRLLPLYAWDIIAPCHSRRGDEW